MKVIGSRSTSQDQTSAKIPISQCKISIGNNSSSVEDRAVKFACSVGFRLWQIERCDRQSAIFVTWPKVIEPNWTHAIYLRVVCLRLEGDVLVYWNLPVTSRVLSSPPYRSPPETRVDDDEDVVTMTEIQSQLTGREVTSADDPEVRLIASLISISAVVASPLSPTSATF